MPILSCGVGRVCGEGRAARLGGETCGSAAALACLKPVNADAGSHVLPDIESLTAEVNSGQVETALISRDGWYPLTARPAPLARRLHPGRYGASRGGGRR